MSDMTDDETGADDPRAEDARTNRSGATPALPQKAPETFEGERIAKAIARAGLASRRDAEAMIEAGRVSLNGQILTSPAVNVTEADRIVVDGEPLPARERTRLWILHKSRGVVTTARDPEGRQTVFDGLPDDLPRVVAIGRLDINTEGLLLLTNDGGLAKVIAHPETGWLRRYRVRAFGDVTQPDLDKLRKGVTIDGMEYGPVEASLDRAQGDNVWLTLGLREGKNREVKRILEHLGLSVNRLIRLSFGPFQLGDLEVGLVEEIRTKVLKEQLGKGLAEQAGVDFESPVREPIAPFGSPKKAARAAATQERAAPARKAERARPRDEARAPTAARSRSGERPGRDPARPAASSRVPTGGFGPGPRRSVWRADEAAAATEGPRATRIPRRGGDPKTAQAAAAERGRERVGAITAAGERRVLVERLQPSPEVPAAEPHRRVKFRTRDENAEARPQRREAAGEARPRRARVPEGDVRPERRGPPRERSGDHPAGRSGERRPRGGGFDRPAEGERRARSGPREGAREGGRDDRAGGGFRADKPGGGRPGGGFKGGGGKPGGFKSGGFKGASARDGGAQRDGYKGRAESGTRSGGGFKSGGARPGGGKPGGGFKGGFKGGGKPGGRPGGGGRPPRGGGR